MIVAYAGVQPDAADRPTARLSPAAVPDVAARLRRLFARLRPRLVIGAAAAGADLLVLRSALQEGSAARIVLPFDVETFARTSVLPAGDEWTAAFWRLVGGNQVDVVAVEEGSANPADDRAYHDHNAVLLQRASELTNPDEVVWTVAIRPPLDPARPSVTDDFVARAEERSLLVLDLDPTIGLGQRRTAFVAMPYRSKFDPVTRLTVDCDQMFDRVYVPVLEDLDFEWKRADLETDSGVIHIAMIDDLANSDLVIADLVTANANVAYELGLRHAIAGRTTVLVQARLAASTAAQAPPFDLAPIRAVSVNRSLDLTEREAQQAVYDVRRLVAGALAGARPDSPVHAWFENAEAGGLRRRGGGDPAVDREAEVRHLTEKAIRSASKSQILSAADTATTAAISGAARIGLLLQLGAALLADRHYHDAARVLAGGEPPAGSLLRERWLQQLAMARRRAGEAELENGGAPDRSWEEADRLLQEALDGFGPTAETCGIAAGLAKRRLAHDLSIGDRVRAGGRLQRMTELYRRGHEAEPSYYTGVNLVAGLRLKGQRFGGSEADLREAAESLVVTRFLARRAMNIEPETFWPAATLAEVELHSALLECPNTPDLARAADTYAAAAALPAARDHLHAARYQIEFLVACGDPKVVIDALADILRSP